MRKVYLRMNENYKYKIIKKLVETNGNKLRAASKLKCSLRTVDRLIVTYNLKGKEGFIHGNRNRKPSTAFDEVTKNKVITLYNEKYYDSNLTHFSELLLKNENISVSARSLNNWLKEMMIVSPKAHKSTKKDIKIQLKNIMTTSKDKKCILECFKKIDLIDDSLAHRRRPRCKYFGELIQMDASQYLWFGNSITHLHVAIDDATGTIVGAYFDTQETLKGYYQVLHTILIKHGIPACFYTDKRTVFEYKKKVSSTTEDTFTQFSYACSQLGIEIKTTSIPQAKGRVERLNQTLQCRLPIELRLAGISSIEEANAYLNQYIIEFNKQFALPINNIKSVFEKKPSSVVINQTLSIIEPRVIDSGHSIKYKNDYYAVCTKLGQVLNFPKGSKGLVIRSFDQELYFSINESVYVMEKIECHEVNSKDFDEIPILVKNKRYVPPMSHPWKIGTFNAHLHKMKHRIST